MNSQIRPISLEIGLLAMFVTSLVGLLYCKGRPAMDQQTTPESTRCVSDASDSGGILHRGTRCLWAFCVRLPPRPPTRPNACADASSLALESSSRESGRRPAGPSVIASGVYCVYGTPVFFHGINASKYAE